MLSSEAALRLAEDPQHLLEIAERVTLACGIPELDKENSECALLCEGYLCCGDGGGAKVLRRL